MEESEKSKKKKKIKENLIAKIQSMDVEEIESKTVKKEKKKKEEKQPKVKRKLENGKRINRDEILRMKIKDTNDLMVRLIKEKINETNLTLNDIYETLGECDGYNLFYGISTRDSMAWKTFETWCDLLNLEPTIIVSNKN